MASIIIRDGMSPTTKHHGLTFSNGFVGQHPEFGDRNPVPNWRVRGITPPIWSPAKNSSAMTMAVIAQVWAGLTYDQQDAWDGYGGDLSSAYAAWVAYQLPKYQYGCIPLIGPQTRTYLQDFYAMEIGVCYATGNDFIYWINADGIPPYASYYVEFYLDIPNCVDHKILGGNNWDDQGLMSPAQKTPAYTWLGRLGPFSTSAVYEYIDLGNTLSDIIGFKPHCGNITVRGYNPLAVANFQFVVVPGELFDGGVQYPYSPPYTNRFFWVSSTEYAAGCPYSGLGGATAGIEKWQPSPEAALLAARNALSAIARAQRGG